MFKNNKKKCKNVFNKFLILGGFIATLNSPIIKAMPNNNSNNVDKTEKINEITTNEISNKNKKENKKDEIITYKVPNKNNTNIYVLENFENVKVPKNLKIRNNKGYDVNSTKKNNMNSNMYENIISYNDEKKEKIKKDEKKDEKKEKIKKDEKKDEKKSIQRDLTLMSMFRFKDDMKFDSRKEKIEDIQKKVIELILAPETSPHKKDPTSKKIYNNIYKMIVNSHDYYIDENNQKVFFNETYKNENKASERKKYLNYLFEIKEIQRKIKEDGEFIEYYNTYYIPKIKYEEIDDEELEYLNYLNEKTASKDTYNIEIEEIFDETLIGIIQKDYENKENLCLEEKTESLDLYKEKNSEKDFTEQIKKLEEKRKELRKNLKKLFTEFKEKYKIKIEEKDVVTTDRKNIVPVLNGEMTKREVLPLLKKILLSNEETSLEKLSDELATAKLSFLKAMKGTNMELEKEKSNREETNSKKSSIKYNNLGYYLLNLHAKELQYKTINALKSENIILNNTLKSLSHLSDVLKGKEINLIKALLIELEEYKKSVFNWYDQKKEKEFKSIKIRAKENLKELKKLKVPILNNAIDNSIDLLNNIDLWNQKQVQELKKAFEKELNKGLKEGLTKEYINCVGLIRNLYLNENYLTYENQKENEKKMATNESKYIL